MKTLLLVQEWKGQFSRVSSGDHGRSEVQVAEPGSKSVNGWDMKRLEQVSTVLNHPTPPWGPANGYATQQVYLLGGGV